MRDISRQIPLLKEQLALHNKKFSKVILSRKKNKEKEVKEEKSIEIKQNKKKHQRKEKKKKVVPRNKSK
ncbi:MAG: hypothetical protein Q8Q01_01220 [archaeon]|nr:hypothetical protein [archaeon]